MSGKSTLRSFSDIMGTAKLPEKTIPLCLRGDLVADFEELERQLEEAQAEQEKLDSLDAGEGALKIIEKMEELRAEMREHTYTFRVRALSRREYRALIANHPPRRSGDDDKLYDSDATVGFNVETFPDELLRTALVDPKLSNAEWEDLQERLTDRQFDDLSTSAWLLNRQEVDIPFSQAASRMNRNSGSE